jgi:enamine deaminase RidA (YjgF/YER057c/UK114 family)
MQRVLSDRYGEPSPGTWSNCKTAGDLIFVAGQVAMNADGSVVGEDDAYAQAVDVFERIQAYVEAAGGKLADVIKVTIYVTDMVDRAKVHEARRKFFTGDFPCSTLVEVSALVDPRLKVEIEAIAVRGAG